MKYFKLLRKYNSLKVKYDVLVEATKVKLLDNYLTQVNNLTEIKRVKQENRRLRLQVKALKEKLPKERNK